MYIIGVKPSHHDVSFAVIDESGNLIYSVEEERFNRVKHSYSYTSFLGLEYAIKKFNISPLEVSYISSFADLNIGDKSSTFDLAPNLKKRLNDLKSVFDINRNILNYINETFFNNNAKIDYVRHHMAHASSAFYVSPFKEASILTVDGEGELETAVLAFGNRNKIEEISNIKYPNSLGAIYTLVTQWLGFGGYGNEGKTMGLSAYGTPKYYKLFTQNEIWDSINGLAPIIEIDQSGFFKTTCLDLASLISIIGPKRESFEPITQYHCDISATVQAITEEIMLKLTNTLYEKKPSKNLCLAGGVILNSVANGKILKDGKFENIYIQPMANDAGTALGSAYYTYYSTLNKPRDKKWFIMDNVYLGPEYLEDDILSALKKYKLPVKKSEDVCKWTAEKISLGNVCGWFQGKTEMGPRSLGNRSILADPTRPEMKDIVNEKVKYREIWRPFAPSVLKEDCKLFFETDYKSPFMLFVYNLKKEMADKIPSVSHVDKTARVQTVSKEINEKYYRLIEEFKKIKGIGLLLNTSFNLKGEPIVLTPDEAIEDFLNTDMDILVLGDYTVEKKEVPYKTENKKYNVFSKRLNNIINNNKCLLFIASNRNLDLVFDSVDLLSSKLKIISTNSNKVFFEDTLNLKDITFYEGIFNDKECLDFKDNLNKNIDTVLVYLSGGDIIRRLEYFDNIFLFLKKYFSNEQILIVESIGCVYKYSDILKIVHYTK